jgi:hypothetical protein
MTEIILPGTYVAVHDEGLITTGTVATGIIGLVGTAAAGPIDQVTILNSFSEARQIFGEADTWQDGTKNELSLVRALEQIYNNGGRTVYVVRVASNGAAAATFVLKDEVGGDWATLKAKTPGSWGNAIQIRVTESDATSKTVELTWGTVKEVYSIVTSESSEVSSAAGFASKVNQRSTLVTVTPATAKADSQSKLINTSTPRNFDGGANGAEADREDYRRALSKLENEIVNIVVLAYSDANNTAAELLQAHLNLTAELKRERIGVIGRNVAEEVAAIANHEFDSDRLIYVGPGLKVNVLDSSTRTTTQVTLPSTYTAAAVAGLISSLPVQTSPTNKVLTISGLGADFNASQLERLVQGRVLTIEKRNGYRVVKGITTATNSAWHQITTRRIVDYAIYGVRASCDPYIGKLNNERVRGAMKATLDAFLTKMVNDEALVNYSLEVSATRAQQIAGECIVTMTVQPTFSIDFIKVSMYLG